jgi:DNA-binding PadR family transcriptional regulator
VVQGSVYTTLNRLENKGYLSSRRGEPLPVRGGRSKRYYTVEPEGLEALREMRNALKRMWIGLEPELGQP